MSVIKSFFRLASEIFARAQRSVYKDISDTEVVDRLLAVYSDINLILILKGLNTINDERQYSGNMILQFSTNGLKIH